MKKITKAHFELFKMYALKWISIFGLEYEWDISFAFVKGDGENGASCRWDIQSKTATLVLYYPWNDEFGIHECRSPESVMELYAFHEVLELLLCPLVCMADSRSYDPTMAEVVRHTVINRLENAFLKNDRKSHETLHKARR